MTTTTTTETPADLEEFRLRARDWFAKNAKRIDELLKEVNQHAGAVARYPTDEQIINAIIATDPGAALLGVRIATLDRQSGALTLTRICPTFLDLASAHRSDLASNWGRALFNMIDSPSTVMTLPTAVGIMGEVRSQSVPTSALQFPAWHDGIVASGSRHLRIPASGKSRG